MDELENKEEMLELLSEGIEKNFLKAAKQLTTGLVNMPIRWIERRDAEKTAETNARIAITKATAQQLTERIEVDEEYVKIAATKHAESILKKQINLDNTVAKAREVLHNTQHDMHEVNRKVEDISDDWLDQFRESACQKSSEEVQELFSKVLAGEIRKPGSFSLLALTTLANMDQEVAKLFNTLCSLCFVRLSDPNAYLTRKSFDIDDVRLPILRNTITDEATMGLPIQTKIKEFTNISESIFNTYDININNFQLLLDHRLVVDNTLNKYNHFWYNDELWTFMDPPGQPPLLISGEPTITISGLALTSVGKELFHLTDRETPSQYWERISKFIQDYYDVDLYKFPKY